MEPMIDDDDRPTLPAPTPRDFDTAAEAFFVARDDAPPSLAMWPGDDAREATEYFAAERRRHFTPWVAFLLAGSLAVLAAAWLPILAR